MDCGEVNCEYCSKDKCIYKTTDKIDVLDKIRDEIEEHAKINQHVNTERARALCWCLDVIDKYKAESEK